MFLALIKTALSNMRSYQRQYFLTMLGIIIGIGSVIAVFSVGSGAEALITDQIKRTGTNLIGVIAGKSEGDSGPPPIARGIIITTLKEKDVDSLKLLPNVEGVAPIVVGNSIVTSGNISESFPFWASGYQFPLVSDTDLESGRYFTSEEEKSLSRVVVLGKDIKDKFFPNEDPIGKNIKIQQQSFKVIGVIASQGTTFLFNLDNYFFFPYTVAQKQILGIDYVHVIRLKAQDENGIPALMDNIRNVLRKNHKIENPDKDDFSVRSQNQALDNLGNITLGIKIFLTVIAGISLIVGGIGIMNMMLIFISKRKKEIGLRKAIGAKDQHILYQFMIETLVITILGGIIGIIAGILLSGLIAIIIDYFDLGWRLIIEPLSIILSFSLSVLIGIIFGMYPASKAARLNPIDSLRYE